MIRSVNYRADRIRTLGILLFAGLVFLQCNKGDDGPSPAPASGFTINSWSLDNGDNQNSYMNVSVAPVIRLRFPVPIDRSSASSSISMAGNNGNPGNFQLNYSNGDSILLLQASGLSNLTRYTVSVATSLKSVQGGSLKNPVHFTLLTVLDSSDKFPRISDDALLTKVEEQTFNYFWDLGHPVSGLARERNTSGDIVTSGGSGFGIMAIVVGISRNFITRAEGLSRMQTIVGFLKNTAQSFHGAFPHWLNGSTGAVVPFSEKDNGADLVETSYLMQGLLTARQYFNTADAGETTLRNDINSLYNAVEWSWFRKNNENVLYWHWSPNYAWDMNFPIRGWNECLITYVMAASSPTYSIPKTVYDEGWANNGSILNGQSYYGYVLPLGEAQGGPLFFSHYSFLGMNPNGLSDTYANYELQTKNHSLINYSYCVSNPKHFYGYSNLCWGLTASDISGGYTASSPTNDVSVIAPTAAISSLPYTPAESMNALKFFYYKLGDKIWKDYGFVDAFSLDTQWFASSYLAIDEGPIIIMIENYRTGLLWNLFTSAPEVKAGMSALGFSAPYL